MNYLSVLEQDIDCEYARYSAQRAIRFTQFQHYDQYSNVRDSIKQIREDTGAIEFKLLVNSKRPLTPMQDSRLRRAYADQTRFSLQLLTVHPQAVQDELSRWLEPPFGLEAIASDSLAAQTGAKPILCICEEPERHVFQAITSCGYPWQAFEVHSCATSQQRAEILRLSQSSTYFGLLYSTAGRLGEPGIKVREFANYWRSTKLVYALGRLGQHVALPQVSAMHADTSG
jgi:hypothetical protein